MSIQFSAEVIKPVVIEHIIRLSKPAQNQLNDGKIRQQMDAVLATANTAQRVQRGWKVDYAKATDYNFFVKEYNYSGTYDGQYIYHVDLKIECHPQKERPTLEAEFQNLLNAIASKAKFPGKWGISKVDGKAYEAKSVEEQRDTNEDVGYAPLEIPENWGDYFDHLYGLEAHISRVKRALEGTVLTSWHKRLHCALIGPPGCGKSDIVHSIKKALGEESVLEFDATSTTQAGAQKELSEREELPRVLLVEEIEKAPEGSLSWLLSVLDLRGEIRKTTARGNILRDTKMIAIATVNDLPTFQKVAFGALASRFANKVYFHRPDRELLGRILEREVNAVNGKSEWINPTLDFAEQLKTTDPREVISLMLCGRDGLLDNTFQREMQWTSPEGIFDASVKL